MNVSRETVSCFYFPIQNLLKILPSISSVVTSPVISPRDSNAIRVSSAKNSGDSPASIALRKDFRLSIDLSRESLCLSSVNTISLPSERFDFLLRSSRILSLSSSIPVPSFADVLTILSCCICDFRSFSVVLASISDLFSAKTAFATFNSLQNLYIISI